MTTSSIRRAVGPFLFFLFVALSRPGLGESAPSEWRIGPAAWSFNRFTFYEAVDKTAALGLHAIEAFEGQRLRGGAEAKLGLTLSEREITEVRAKLAARQVKLTSIYIFEVPQVEATLRPWFEFCRTLGIETIISEPPPQALNLVEKLCDEFGINLAIHNHPKGSSRYWHPQEVLNVCVGRSPRIGACADIGHWQRSGIDPVEGIRLLGRRLLTLHVKDLHERGAQGYDVPWGTGTGEIKDVLAEVRQSGVQPTLFAIEYEKDWDNNSAAIGQCAAFFKRTVDEFAAERAEVNLPLRVGWATADITPPQPVALVGQLHKRISIGVRDPLSATVLALDTRDSAGKGDQAILVSCDVLFIQRAVQERVQDAIRNRLPGFDSTKLFLNATHSHTGPGFSDSTFKGLYDVSLDRGVMKASEYADFFVTRVTDAVAKAWETRQLGGLSWALSHAAVGSNRRAHYFDRTSVMYGSTASAGFSHIEGYQDSALALLFLWKPDGGLSGVVVNLPCPSQETENLNEISADFWSDVRQELRQRHGRELFVLAQSAPAGDQSPHLLYRRQAEEIMEARRGLSRRKELARRIANAVDDALPVARQQIQSRLELRHTVARIKLPMQDPGYEPFYETDSVQPMELHVMRLGEVALATSPFELFVDYGLRIENRSRAVLTMQVQLCSGSSGYLPTARAVSGGGYSADKFVVGPPGGQVLVEETVQRINELFH